MKKILISTSLVILSCMAMAQVQSAFNLYGVNPYLINPSLVGRNSSTNVFAHYRNQFSGFSEAPVFKSLSIDHKMADRKFGLGLQFYNESAGLLSSNGMEIAYAYNVPLSSDWQLNFGLAASFSQKAIDFSNANMHEEEAAALAGNMSNTLFDGNFGLSIQRDEFTFGIAIPNLMQSDVDFDGNDHPDFLSLQNRRSFEFFANYQFDISDKFSLQPMALVRTITDGGMTYDLGAFLHYKKTVFAGISYQSAYSASISAGLRMTEGLTLAYNYSYPLNDISTVSVGGHELAIGFSLSSLGSKKPIVETESPKGKQSSKLNELQKQVFDQGKMNIRQKEEIDRMKQIMRDNDVEASLQAIKDEAKKRLEDPKEGELFYIVLGAFSDLSTAQQYQKLLQRKSPSVRSTFIKKGDWVLVYAKKYSDPTTAQKMTENTSQKNLSLDEPWIYVSKP